MLSSKLFDASSPLTHEVQGAGGRGVTWRLWRLQGTADGHALPDTMGVTHHTGVVTNHKDGVTHYTGVVTRLTVVVTHITGAMTHPTGVVTHLTGAMTRLTG